MDAEIIRAAEKYAGLCRFRGTHIGERACESCGRGVRLKLFACPFRSVGATIQDCHACHVPALDLPAPRASAPMILCLAFPDYRGRHWTFFLEPWTRAGCRIEFAVVDECGPLAAVRKKAAEIGMPDVVIQWDEHGHARANRAWRDVVAWAYAHDVVPLMLDFGYVSHYEQFMFDVYRPDGSSMIALDWPTVPETPIDWEKAPFIPRDRRRRVLRGYKDAKLKPRLIEDPYICLWLQQYASLSRMGERHNNEIVANAAFHAKRLGLRLAVKTSPSTPPEAALTTWPDDVAVFKHASSPRDINQRLAVHAEYCLVVSSSITNEFVLNGLPVVAVGRSWFNGKGIFYEPPSWGDLPDRAPAIDQAARNRWVNWWLSHQFTSKDAGPALQRIVAHGKRFMKSLAPRPGSSATCVYAPDAHVETIALGSIGATAKALPGWKVIVGIDAASPPFVARMFHDKRTILCTPDGAPPRMKDLLAAAVQAAEGRYLFTIEHDNFLERKDAERAVRIMDALPTRVAGLYLQSVTPDAAPTYPWTNDWPRAVTWARKRHYKSPLWTAFSCALWRLSALREVNWTRVPMLEFADGVVCRQLSELGYITLMTDRAHVVHLPHTGRRSLAGRARTLAIGCDRHWASVHGIRFGWNGDKDLDVRGNACGALPFDDESFRDIFLARPLKELSASQLALFLAEVPRVLSANGRFHVHTDDPRVAARIASMPLRIIHQNDRGMMLAKGAPYAS